MSLTYLLYIYLLTYRPGDPHGATSTSESQMKKRLTKGSQISDKNETAAVFKHT